MSTFTRISIRRRTPRWDDEPATAADALDLWSFGAAAANVVMQLAAPPVGHGVLESTVESGQLMRHPWKRARTTLSYISVALLGSDADRVSYRAAVDTAHRPVHSGPDSPVQYNAFDPDLQLWVAAAIFVGLEDCYQLLRGELSAEAAEVFYRSAFPLGTTLQVREEQWPPTRADFDRYWDQACASIQIDEPVRDYLQDLIALRMLPWVLRPGWAQLLRFLTTGFLAPVFRDALGLAWSARRQWCFERLFLLVALGNRFLPKFIRQAPGYLLLFDVKLRLRRGAPLI